MAQVEPMDVDNVGSDFDDKENSLLHSNVLPRTPCTEKGYEELDVSELNMKLRYSITPASSPMSKSFTANCKDNKTYSINEDSLNSTIVNNSTSLTRSLNATISKFDVSKSPKLPLQALSTDQYVDMNSKVRRSLDNDLKNITISIDGNDIDENISLPSTSSSAVQTPEATTPTKEIPKDGGSPIMRGLKSVLNMFRTSQSPIPPDDNLDKKDITEHLKVEEKKPETVLASTPKACDKNKDNSSKRSSPLKDSMIFNDDLERELQWKDDSTIIFKQEKIPIHKLFLQQSTSTAIEKIQPKTNESEKLNSTVEYMDISYNDSVIADKTMADIESKMISSNIEASVVESDGEFLDCETTYIKSDDINSEQINTTIPVNTDKEHFLQDVCTDKIISLHKSLGEINNIANDSKIISTDLSSVDAHIQFEERESLSSSLNDVKPENVVNDTHKLIPDVTEEENNVQFEKLNTLSSTLTDVKLENVVNDTHKLIPDVTEEENNVQFEKLNTLSSTLTDVKLENVVNDTHKLIPDVTEEENNVQFEKLNTLSSTLNDVKPENVVNDTHKLIPDVTEEKSNVQFEKLNTLSSTLNDVKPENVVNDTHKLIPDVTDEKSNVQFEKLNTLSSTLTDVKLENVVNDTHKLIPDVTEEENYVQFEKLNTLSSTLNDVKPENVVKDTHKLIPDVKEEENNVQFEELNILTRTLNDVKSGNVVNDTYEQIPDVAIKCQKESNLIDDIQVHEDVTSALEVSADKAESNNYIDQANVSVPHIYKDDIKLDSFAQDKQLLNNLTHYIQEDASSTELTFDVTKPLNIVTDNDNTLAKVHDRSNNFEIIGKEKLEVIELNSQPLNSGILQICENKAGDTRHDHANTTLDILDFKSEAVHLEENKIEYHVIDETFEKTKTSSSISKNYESNEIHNHTEDLLNKSDRVDLSCLNNTTDSLHINKQPDLEDKITCLNFVENDDQSNSYESTEKPIGITDIGYNNSQPSDNIPQLSDNALQSIEPQVTELINNFPSDIPLPSDDDIEKDSLMDNFEIQNENVVEALNNVDGISINDQIMDSLEPMDVVTREDLTINPEHSNEMINILPASSLDEIQNKIEPLSNLPISSYETNNKTVVLNESATIVANNEPNFPYSLPELNKTETLSEDKSASVKTNENHKYINCEKDIEEIKLEESTKIEIEELKNDNTSDEGLNENKLVDEEIVTSANSSPFVSVGNFDLNVNKNDINLDEIESPFETKTKIALSPPISPNLNRKGYNINFDDIDDPFATKTNIRMSPPPESSPRTTSAPININQKKTDIQKRVQQQNRRKSQPERQKRDLTKKRINISYSCDTRGNNYKKQMSTTNNENENKKLIDKNYKTDINSTIITSVIADQFVAENIDPFDNKCEMDDVNTSDNNLFNLNETVTIPDESKPLYSDLIQDNTTGQKAIIGNISAKKFPPKNVFNLPEIDDMNFNPFASKSKIRNSPSPTFEKESVLLEENNLPSDPINEMKQKSVADTTVNIESQEDKIESPNVSSETFSSKNINKNSTVKEIATEDEDTVEGPFLEAEEFSDVVKISDFATERDVTEFENFHTAVNPEIKDEGELFIDAEAFEFLLNQNKSNVVADSGKESLFLKFDPLFAKRVSSDGVLAALNRIQKRQSTPKKAPSTPNQNAVINEERPSSDATKCNTLLEESNDENNITIVKPMMVVSPAINSLVSPRKSTSPPRINRRSLTFTSPAMAVIDRLLSLSSNSSTLDHDASPPRINREYNDTNIALTQLRELLAEKEIHVHNLRSESKELKERLAVMESQVKTLEKESEERLKKVNDLNERLAEKTKINKSMAVVVEEYERTIASLIAEMDQEKRRNAEERARIISERDEQTAHLSSMEVSFSDLHSKYEKSKQIILSMKANEDTYKKSLKDFEDNLLKMQNNYELLKQHATSKLNHANQELEKFNRAHESEVLKLNAMIKRKELHITSLEESLAQKTKANEELTAICDELINKVG
ncbi:uncharacterized protein LOC123662319 [Melitaea cinxia]|uniref:uncharacterized protein LOC123662319 n=1 Tax=Melitaea cinxia TaxID=113334 RepID=UPI001E26EFF2|nr:uncharacterized protein LOC123662319 [Melitaea cinxia]